MLPPCGAPSVGSDRTQGGTDVEHPARTCRGISGPGRRIRALKQREAHFAKLVDDYDAVNDKVHRAETRVDVVTEAEEEALRHKRSHLKDQIARALAAA